MLPVKSTCNEQALIDALEGAGWGCGAGPTSPRLLASWVTSSFLLLQNEIFASRHQDENSVACIEEKCYVLTFAEYCR